MKTLIIDNFDSFTYNLYQFCAEFGANPKVVRNNEIKLNEIKNERYTHIILSPGPGSPENHRDFGICGEVIDQLSGSVPILGVCLGHQGIVYKFGGKVVKAPVPVHGKQSVIKINTKNSLFRNLSEETVGMRYHSLLASRKDLPKDFEIIAATKEGGLIMAIAHKKYPLYGIQFHPESIGTPDGRQIIKNFLDIKFSQEQKKDLSAHKMENLLEEMINHKSENEITKILKRLAEKGESISEITGMVQGMRKHAVEIPIKAEELLDTCGTGGSGLDRMNISTTAAFVLAACGIKIAKHGNRAASGRCGSFDLLENLGINIQLSPEAVAKSIKTLGVGFLYAPKFHPVIAKFMPIRKKLGIRTIFNLIGPLINPAKPAYHLLGTTSVENAEKLIQVMKNIGYIHAMVVVGEKGLDEITLNGSTECYELKNGKIRRFTFKAENLGLQSTQNTNLGNIGTVSGNTEFFLALLQNKAPKALENLLLINCAFGLLVRGFSTDLRDGFKKASEVLKSGSAYKKFLDYKNFSLSL